MIEPLIRTIELPCDQQMAFEVFIDEMDTWWPLAKFTVSAMSGNTAKSIRVETKVGGKIVEIGPNNEEHLWGTIKSYHPYEFVSMDFHIPQPDEIVKERSLVEVEFVKLGDEKTQVTLTQTNWEAFGDLAEALRGGYNGGWTMIFSETYKAFIEAKKTFHK